MLQGFRDVIVDSIRGFAIILIVIGHCVIWLHRSGVVFRNDEVLRSFVYSFHVPLLFMVSGYVHAFSERWQDGKGYAFHVKKSFIEIYLPYLFFSYVGYCASLLMFATGDNPINFNAAHFDELFQIPYSGFREYWFLLTLFVIKLAHTAFECGVKSERANTIFWAIIFCLINYVDIKYLHLPLHVRGISYGIYFHAGYIMKKYDYISQNHRPKLFYGILFLAAGLIFFSLPYFCGFSNFFTRTLTTICMCFAAFFIFYALNFKNAFFVLSGANSMVIYIVHDYVIFCGAMACKFGGLPENMAFAAFLFCLVAAVLISLCVVQLYKKVKIFRWVEYIFYPGKFFFKRKA